MNSDMALIRADTNGVPVSFPLGEDGFCRVTALRLRLRFHLREESMHVEEEVFDAITGDLTHTVAQVSFVNDEGKLWLLKPGKYRVYGLCESVPCSSVEFHAPRLSSTSTQQNPMPPKVKVEPGIETINILSDDSDNDFPAPPCCSKQHDHATSHQPSPSSVSRSSHARRPSNSKPPLPIQVNDVISVVECLKVLGSRRGSKSLLSKLDFNSIKVEKVEFLPPSFDGDVVFELPPIGKSATPTQARLLRGMDKRYDGHAWTRTITSNIKNDLGLTFRMSTCLGHLRCNNAACDYITRVNRISIANETEWDGCSRSPFEVGGDPPEGSTVVCKICKSPPSCIRTCPGMIYYVIAKDHMTRACVHVGSHSHPVKIGINRESMERTRTLLEEQVQRTPTATNSAIVLEASKELIGELLLCPEGAPRKTLDFDELVPVLDQCKHMSSPSIRNQVTSFRYLRRFGVMDSITKLRGSSTWAFIQDNKFPGQGSDSDKVFVFKMSEVGPGSGVDLVRRMQPGGDLEDAWMMFDHVKRVKSWTTMACHVYDSKYCRVMSIAVCDMQSEDTAAQTIFWKNLNAVIARHGIPLPKFKGFMADSAQANWNAVRIVYGSGDATTPMENQERTCLFHWTQSLEKHTKADIRPNLQDQHRRLCKQYKDAKTPTESESRYLAIRSWWLSSGAATDDALFRLEQWLAFWHFRYRQWGGFMQLVRPNTFFKKHVMCCYRSLNYGPLNMFHYVNLSPYSPLGCLTAPLIRRAGRDAVMQSRGVCT